MPSRLGDIDADVFFAKPESSRRRLNQNRVDVDVDTLPNLEPYRREVAALKPITFGHRPVSASRMFNPSTMMTSFGSSSCSATHNCAQKGGGGGGASTGVRNKPRQFPLKRASREAPRVPGRVPGLSAPMLKELLLGKSRPRGGEARAGFPSPAAAYVDGDTCREYRPGPRGEGKGEGEGGKGYAKGEGDVAVGVVVNREDGLSDGSASNVSEWQSVGATGSGMRRRRGEDDAAWLKLSGLVGLHGERGVIGGLVEQEEAVAELRRIFSDDVRRSKERLLGERWPFHYFAYYQVHRVGMLYRCFQSLL